MKIVAALLSVFSVALFSIGCSSIDPMKSGTVRGMTVSKYAFDDDYSRGAVGNGDNLPNKSETLRMNIEICNSSVSFDGQNVDLTGVTATLATRDPYVTIDPATKTQAFGDIPSLCYSNAYYADGYAGATTSLTVYDEYKFSISGSCPAGHQVTFTLSISDDQGTVWSDTITFAVVAIGANIVFNKYGLLDNGNNGTIGNSDRLPNRNETLRMNVELRNSGTSQATGISATLTSADPYITIDTASKTQTFGDISASYYSNAYYGDGYAVSNADLTTYDEYKFSIMATCPLGHQAQFVLAISDDMGNSWASGFSLKVQ